MAGYYYDRSRVPKSVPEGWGYSDSPRDKAADRYGHPAILGPKEEPAPKVGDFMNSVQNAAWCSSAADERRMLGLFPKGGMFQHHKDDRNGYSNSSYRHENSNIDAAGATSGWEKRYGNGYANAGYGAPLGRVTNDVGTAANYVREESGRPPVPEAGTSRWGSGGATGVTTIDSREAAKKYRGYFM